MFPKDEIFYSIVCTLIGKTQSERDKLLMKEREKLLEQCHCVGEGRESGAHMPMNTNCSFLVTGGKAENKSIDAGT